MIYYITRRILYAVPLLLGVNILTFILFFIINSPDDMARMQLGQKRVTEAAIINWKQQHDYDLPLFWNEQARSSEKLSETIFYQKSMGLFLFHFGVSDSGRDISSDIKERALPSLSLALPSLILGLITHIGFALIMILFRNSRLERLGMIFCIVLMSISSLFYIISGQFIFGKIMKLVPISGFDDGLSALRFLLLPIMISVFSGLGSGGRWYRSIFLEESGKDYIRTARAKGLTEIQTLFRHVLPNAMIPILTGVVVILPSLFMGSLMLESFFGIPGLGSYTIDAINSQDFAIVRAMVFLGSVLYILGLLLTDVSYSIVDPRIRIK